MSSMKSKTKRQRTSHESDNTKNNKTKQLITKEKDKSENEGDSDNNVNLSNLINNEYKGCSTKTADDKNINTISTKSFPHLTNPISKKDFFVNYISKRKPCIMDFHPSQINSKKDKIITRDALKEICGEEMVQVEKRDNANEQFGKERIEGKTQITMKFKNFLNKVCDSTTKKELYYFSTQEGEDDDEIGSNHGVHTVPCRQLLEHDYIPNTLDLAGNLILSACNMWIGSSTSSSSSGLHHDHHDNFYILLHGEKTFRLFSPDCAPFMQTKGIIEKIHFNGKISYFGMECRADGILLDDDGSIDNDENENNGESEDDEKAVIGKGFDYQSSDEEENDMELLLKGEEEDYDFDENGVDDFDENDGCDADDMDSTKDDESFNNKQKQDMLHFSKIPSKLLDDKKELVEQYPKFDTSCQCIIKLQAGQSLYLPTGWFHEVQSSSFCNEKEKNNGLEACHVAINYWYHPPDKLADFDFPYKDQKFWSKLKNNTT